VDKKKFWGDGGSKRGMLQPLISGRVVKTDRKISKKVRGVNIAGAIRCKKEKS